ncbi:MAG: hypothetical protein FJX25_17785 [Alphaproteobacteria bacterium]|nr:hypothetical protein [Alphaproteobacteria bacterium]
MSCRDRTNDR